tara:strand:+ start:1612 stop:4566 length:2955 start_codon:yes stop_codon:yes gene_type:complete
MDAIVYGGKEHYIQAFNAIAIMIGQDSISSLIRLVLLLGLMIILFQVAMSRQVGDVIKWFLTASVILSIGFVPKTDVVIHDRVNPGVPTTVANVPLVLAFTFSVASTAGDTFTRQMETVFGDPDIAQYSKGGMIYGSRLMFEANDLRFLDEPFGENMDNYMADCIYYEVAEGDMTIGEIRDNPALFDYITQDHAPNPGRSGRLVGAGGTTIESCDTIATWLRSNVADSADTSMTALGRRMHPDMADASARAAIATEIEGAHTLLIGQSRNAADIFVQAMTINAFREGAGAFAAESGGSGAAWAQTRAELQMRNQNMLGAQLAHKWIPYLKIVLEILFYCMFPLLFPFMLLPRFGVGLIRSYFGGFIMLQAWGPLFVILNKIMMTSAVSQTMAELSASGVTALTMFNLSAVAEANADIASVAGGMALMIPVIASALAYGVDKVAGQSESLMSAATSGAADGARDQTTGNMSLGSTGFDTHRFNQQFGNQHETAHTNIGGMYTQSTGSGGRLTHTPNGDQVYDNSAALSRIGADTQFSRTIGSQAQRRASQMESYAQNWSQEASSLREQGTSALFSDGQTASDMAQTIASSSSGFSAEQRAAAATVARHSQNADQTYQQAVEENSELGIGGEAYALAKVGTPFSGVAGSGAEAGSRANARWSETDREQFRSTYQEGLGETESRELSDAMAIVSSASQSDAYSQSGGVQNQTTETAAQQFRQADSYADRASRARTAQQSLEQTAAQYESGNLTWSQPMNDQFLDYMGQQTDPNGVTYSSTGPGWQDAVTDMIQNADPALQDMMVGFANQQLDQLPAVADVSSYSIGGGDLVDSGAIPAGQAMAGDVTTVIGNNASTMSAATANVGLDNATRLNATSDAPFAHAEGGVGDMRLGMEEGLVGGQPTTQAMRTSNEAREAIAEQYPARTPPAEAIGFGNSMSPSDFHRPEMPADGLQGEATDRLPPHLARELAEQDADGAEAASEFRTRF